MSAEQIVPGDFFARAQTISGLRELADFLEANPSVPVDEHGWSFQPYLGVSENAETDQSQRAEVDQIAQVLGTPVSDDRARGGHYFASRTFGRITYKALHIPARRMREYDARASYRGNVLLDDEAA
jgi:hypothetical protein